MICQSDVYLMVDEAIVAGESNTSMVRQEACKHDGNPIVDGGRVELFGGRQGYRIRPLCVCRDQGRYRMWYVHLQAACGWGPWTLAYAESDDGLDFRPVTLRGRPYHPAIVRDPRLQCSSVLHDPLDADWPYKAVIIRQGDIGNINPALRAKYPQANGGWHGRSHDGWFAWGIARSRDGFAWQLPRHRHNLVDAVIEEPNLYRALDGGLVISGQMFSKVSDIGWRKVKGWVTYDRRVSHRIPDFIFSLPDPMTLVNPAFLGRNAWAGTPWAQSHVQLFPAIKGPTMVALHGYLYGAIGAETFAQMADIGLAISDTGYRFEQVWPFRPFIRRGDIGRWDSTWIRQAAIVDHGDQTRFYYIGSQEGNADGPRWLGMARIDLDRYGYRALRVMRDWTRKPRCGEVVLKPLTLPRRPALGVNVSHVTPERVVRVELRDPGTGGAIRGFEMDQCVPVIEPGLWRSIRWKKGDIARLAGKSVTVAVELFSPDCLFGDKDSPRVYALYTAKAS